MAPTAALWCKRTARSPRLHSCLPATTAPTMHTPTHYLRQRLQQAGRDDVADHIPLLPLCQPPERQHAAAGTG